VCGVFLMCVRACVCCFGCFRVQLMVMLCIVAFVFDVVFVFAGVVFGDVLPY